MKEIRSFQCEKRPLLSEYQEALKIAQNEHCIVVLQWSVPFIGNFNIKVTEEMEDMTANSFEKMINKMYTHSM